MSPKIRISAAQNEQSPLFLFIYLFLSSDGWGTIKLQLIVIIPSVSRLTDDGQKQTSISCYLYRSKEERNCLLAPAASAVQQHQQRQQRRMEDVADTLVPPLHLGSQCRLGVSASSRFLFCNSSANTAATHSSIARISPTIVCAVSARVSADRQASTSSAHRAKAATRPRVASLFSRCNA